MGNNKPIASISLNISRIIIVLPVAVSYKVIHEMVFCKIPSLPFPAGTGQVVHKIKDHFAGRSIRYPAQHEELIGNNELIHCRDGSKRRFAICTRVWVFAGEVWSFS